jgi:MFS family permease
MQVIFIGAIIGQLSMGFLGDYLSRNNALAMTLSISSLAAFLSSVAPAGSSG